MRIQLHYGLNHACSVKGILIQITEFVYHLQHSAYCLLIPVFVKPPYPAISSTQRRVCVRSLPTEAVAATRTTLRRWKTAISSAILMVKLLTLIWTKVRFFFSSMMLLLCCFHPTGCPPYCTPDYCYDRPTRTAPCTL